MHSRLYPLLVAIASLCPVAAAGLTPHLVKDINAIPQAADSSPADFVTVGGVSFFSANDGDNGTELWRSDGTAGGTYRLTDACEGECSSSPAIFAATDRSIFFLVFPDSGRSARELWVSGGTPVSTFRLTDALLIPPADGLRQRWVASQRLLYFVANDGVHGFELWRSDGTPVGTHMVSDLRPGSLVSCRSNS